MAVKRAGTATAGAGATAVTERASLRGLSQVEAPPTVKVTVVLPEEMAAALKTEAKSSGITFTQALKEAIALKLFVADILEEGGTLVVEQPGKRKKELVVFQY